MQVIVNEIVAVALLLRNDKFKKAKRRVRVIEDVIAALALDRS
jgi:hypothetical protein